ncbi:ankyrin repeat domain-containing protein [uncultured Zobellia sp.]|uniref:ankyrin repeat domain-containing protein n=1 Tax=uncultured Zobellia sp. TaxID=255433 RepID=UPI002599A2CE|nr:ankyrin repeat domain-containing protein [uncultured Zobellia sp.]
MKNNSIRTFALVLSFAFISLSAFAQRNTPKDPNPFLSGDYWEKQPSISTIEANIKEGHSATVANGGGFDATTYALLANNPLSTIKYLVEHGNDVNKKTHDSRTYIFWAAYKGNVEAMEYLIQKGAKLDVVDSHGYYPSSFASAGGQTDPKIYELFIANGADLKNEKDHHGANILLVAASSAKDLKFTDYLISKGLDINTTDNDGNGIFYYAAKGGNIDVLKSLKERGVSIAENDKTGDNAMLAASRVGRGGDNSIEVFKYLEELGISPNVVSKSGTTPLHNLASSKDIKILDYFISKGVDPNAVDGEGQTALIKAAGRNDLETISYFAEKTDKINHADKDGHTALTAAIQNNSADVVTYLISKGASIDVLDKKGNNLVSYLFNGRGKPRDFDAKVAVLKDKGLDFTQVQGDNSTVWHLAVAKNDLRLLKKVKAFGADINGKDKDGNTPLHYAAMKTENAEILKYLIANGADLKSTTEFGETAHDLASENELLAKNKVNLQFLN